MVTTTEDATKHKKGRNEAIALARSVKKLLVVKGKNVLTFDMTEAHDDDTLAIALLGPTGNLRAPTIRVGDMLLVGFADSAYQQLLTEK